MWSVIQSNPQSQVRESYVTVRESCDTAYCIWSVIQSNPQSQVRESYVTVRESYDTQPIARGVSFNQILQSQSNWSLFNGTWQKRPRELDH